MFLVTPLLLLLLQLLLQDQGINEMGVSILRCLSTNAKIRPSMNIYRAVDQSEASTAWWRHGRDTCARAAACKYLQKTATKHRSFVSCAVLRANREIHRSE